MFFTYQSTYSQVKLKLYLRQQFAQFGVVDFDAVIEVEGDTHVGVVVDYFLVFFQLQGLFVQPGEFFGSFTGRAASGFVIYGAL